MITWGCLVQVGNRIELEAVGLQLESYLWRPCGVTWDSSRTVVVTKLQQTSAVTWQVGIARSLVVGLYTLKRKNLLHSF